MYENADSKICIVGPSHILRWRHLFTNTLTCLPKFDSYGMGGLPIWDPELISFLKDSESKYDEIYVVVGDFRFGNNIFDSVDQRNLGIKKDNINIQNDRVLLTKSLDALDFIYNIKNVKFIFWDLYIREFLNKRRGGYTASGHYNHPLWNYDIIQKKYSHKTIKLNQLDSLNLNSFFIDSSLHPSMLGFCFIFNLLTKQSVANSFLSALRLKGCIDKELHCEQPTVIIGNGVFFRTIQYYISNGIISVSSNIELHRADDALFTKRNESRKLILFSESKSVHDLQKIKGYFDRAKWKEKVNFELSFVEEEFKRQHLFELANGLPSFLYVYSVLHYSLNNDSQDNFDINPYIDLLNNHFRKNCLCLS